MTSWESPRLAELAVSLGAHVAAAGNRPITLDDPEVAWFVERGALDVFLVEHGDSGPVSTARHVLRAWPGRVVFGLGEGDVPLAAIAKGLPGSELRRVRLQDLSQSDIGDELADQVDAWLSEFAAMVARQIEPRPRYDLMLGVEGSLDAEAGHVVSTRAGTVTWAATEGTVAYLGTEDPERRGTGLVPLTPETWLTVQRAARITGRASRDLNREGRLVAALADFHRMALGAEHFNRMLSLADEVNEQTARATHRRLDEEQARQDLFNILDPSRPAADGGGSELLAALKLIGEREGIEFRLPPPGRGAEEPSLQDILDASGVRCRKVRLSPEERWWLGDSGAMLGFSRDHGGPVALLPGRRARYSVEDPASGRSASLNARRAGAISEDAWCFYRPLPDDRPVHTKDLVRFMGTSMVGDFARFATAGLLASVLMLAPAVVVGLLAASVLPAGAGGMLLQVSIALVALAVLSMTLQMVQGTAVMRLEGRAAARVGAALWDRLLGLPPSFFKQFTAGELAMRVSVFQVLRDQASGAVANALLSLIFLVPMLALLFFYDVTLAWLSLAIGLVALVVSAALGVLQIAPQRRRYAATRRLSGDLFQFINGISKLRSAGAEASAFASWARGYREQHAAGLQVATFNEHLVAFSAAAPTLVAAVLFAAALWRSSDHLAVSDFLVVFAVSMTFYAAVAALGRSFEALAAVIPGYEQVKPVLETLPERRVPGTAPPMLSGDIRFDHVSFRYARDGSLIIDDVSIHARPGEFVAIVGESGSGKSTLLRLALGLEDPSAGGVYYDGRDLAHLDRRSVRRQVGVVMQDGALRPGNVLDNIIGTGDALTIDDAWRAAALAAVDSDIAAMPMEMFTIVGDTSATFSGGQTQRIRIAAALVRNPRILFLDEATSWLDATSQAQVMRGVASLAVTRIVIAHRLSTIRKAERIYVLQHGRVVQEGGFDELFETEGVFRDLVQRQLR